MSARKIQFAEGEYYHVYSRGVEKRKLFLDAQDYKRFTTLLYSANSDTSVHLSNYQGKALLEITKGSSLCALGAWCLMSNHFHLLLKEKNNNGISTYMQKLLTGYSMYFNKKYKRTGSLFERKFNAKHLDTDRYLKYQYAYIHLNPAGIIDSGWKEKHLKDTAAAKAFISSYPHSSYLDYIGGGREEFLLLEKDAFPDYFQSPSNFREMVNEWVEFDD